MSSFKNALSSKAQDFQLTIEKYQMGEISFKQIPKLFNDFIHIAKESIGNVDENEEDIEEVLDTVHTFLKIAIDYAGVGSTLHKLTHFRLLCTKIIRAINYLEMKYHFLKSLSIPIFEILLDPDLQTWIAREILKMYCIIVYNADRSFRISIVKDNFSYYMSRFMDLISFGDYEFQALIVDTLFRIYTNKELKENESIFFFKTEEQQRAFYSIDRDNFDFSLRLYLNLVNDKEKNVVSVLCHKVCMDEFQLREPDELSACNGLWIDFNIKVGTITFYIDNRGYCDMMTADDELWEIVTIFSENISNAEISIAYNEEKGSEEAVGKLKLKDSCLLLKERSHKLTNSRTLTLYSTNVKRLKEIFHRDIPEMTKKIKTKKVHTSLNRRGYKPLDIISIKSSTTNYSSSLNHTFNTEMGCKNLRQIRSVVGNQTSITLESSSISERSLMDFNLGILNTSSFDEIIDGQIRNDIFDHILDVGGRSKKCSSIDQSRFEKCERDNYLINKSGGSKRKTSENVYEEASLTQLMNIEADSPKSNGHSYSSHDEFDTATETFARTEMIKTDKNRNASEYGQKFSSNLLQMEDLKFERRRSASYGKDSKSKSVVMDVPSLKLKKKAHSLSNKLYCQLIKTEPDSTTLESDQGIKDSELLFDEVATSERSAFLSSNAIDISTEETLKKMDEKNQKRKMSAHKPIKNENSPITKIKIPEDQIHKSQSKNKKTVSISVIHCSPKFFSSQIKVFHNDENKPPKKLSIKKTCFNKSNNSKLSVLVNSLKNVGESPDSIRDVPRDAFDEFEVEIPNRLVQLQEDPKIDTIIEDPNFIETNENIVSENTGFFETARTDLEGIEIPESQSYVEKSLELIKDTSQEELLSMSIRNIDDDLNANIRSKIKILTSIKIQSSLDKEQSKGSIHTLDDRKNREILVEDSEGEISGKKLEKLNIIPTSETMNTPLDETQITQSEEKLTEFYENYRSTKNINISPNYDKVEISDGRNSFLKEKPHFRKRKMSNTAVPSVIGIQNEFKKSIFGKISDSRDKNIFKSKTSNRKDFTKNKSQSQENVVIPSSAKYSNTFSLVQTNIDENIHIHKFPSSPHLKRKSNKPYTQKYLNSKDQEIENSNPKPENSLSFNKINKVPLNKLTTGKSSSKAFDQFDSEDELPLPILKTQLFENVSSQKFERYSNPLKYSNFIQEDTANKERKEMLVHNIISDNTQNINIEENHLLSGNVRQRENVQSSELLHCQSQARIENVSVKPLRSDENVSNVKKKPKLSHKVTTTDASMNERESNYFQNKISEKHSQQIKNASIPTSYKENMISNAHSQSPTPKKYKGPFESITAVESINQHSVAEDQIPENMSLKLDVAIQPAEEDLSVFKIPISRQKQNLRRNRYQNKNQVNEVIQSFAEADQNERNLFLIEEIEGDNSGKIQNELMADENSQVINIVKSENSAIRTDSNLESDQRGTRSQNIRVSKKLPYSLNSDTLQSSFPSKPNEMKKHASLTSKHGLLSNILSSEFKPTKQSQCIQSTNNSGLGSVGRNKISSHQTETKEKDETISEKNDLSDEIEKSIHLLFGSKPNEHSNETFNDNFTKNNFRYQKNDGRNKSFDASNSIVNSKPGRKLKREKLYDPDSPEETLRTLPEFMKITKENEITQTSLEPTSHFRSKQQSTSKRETRKKSEKQPKTLSGTDNIQPVAKTSIKSRKLLLSKNGKSIRNISSKNDQQSDYRRKSLHTKNFRRLDILIDNVFERLKSRNYSNRTTPLATRLTKYENNNLDKKYDLDLSLKRVDEEIMKKERESRVKQIAQKEKRLSKFNDVNNSNQNNSKGEAGLNRDVHENDRDLPEFMRALSRICVKLGSGELIVTSSSKKKFLAMEQLFSDF